MDHCVTFVYSMLRLNANNRSFLDCSLLLLFDCPLCVAVNGIASSGAYQTLMHTAMVHSTQTVPETDLSSPSF